MKSLATLYIDICNKIAGYAINGDVCYHHLEDIPDRINGVGVELSSVGFVILTKPGMRIYLDNVGEELQVFQIKGTLGADAKYVTDVSSRKNDGGKYAYQEFIMPGMKFSLCYLPLYIDGDRKQASYASEQFGHHFVTWPRSHAPINEDLAKMKRLRELIGSEQTSHVEVQMRYSETCAELCTVFLGVCGMPGFIIHFSKKENRLVFTYYNASPNISQECIDFFIDIATALNLPPI